MPTTTEAPAGTAVSHDLRRFWRVLLAVIAPLPMLFMGVQNLLSPVDGGEPFAGAVAAYRADLDLAAVLQWLQVPFLALLTPAAFAVAWVARRGAPRLATAGALVTLTGFLTGFGVLGGSPHPAYLTARDNLDVAAVGRLVAADGEHPIVLLGGLLFILGITIGLLLLGIALWRSRTAPAWTGAALALGGFTHPFLPGHVAAGIGLLVAAAGFAGASVALLRTRDDAFDLPPAPARA